MVEIGGNDASEAYTENCEKDNEVCQPDSSQSCLEKEKENGKGSQGIIEKKEKVKPINFTSPFDNELCPICRTMFRSHAILNKKILSCGDCGIHFTPLKIRNELNKLSGKIKWKSQT